MKSFKDSEGREWLIDINVDTIKRVKSLTGLDLLSIVDGTLADSLVDDPVALVDAVYCLCKPQADERQLSDVNFGRSMKGDAIDHATRALLEDLVDFFPSRKRQVLMKLLATANAIQDKRMTAAETTVSDPTFESQLEAALNRPGSLSGVTPASLG